MAATQHPHVNLSWSVDTSVNKVLNIGTNVLRVCTSDNVQPLALLVCEKFGAQLAMCTETRLKMETLAQRRHTSYLIKYLEFSIGYMAGDAADYFASSDAGARFLGLAAVLMTLGSNFQAAKTLHFLLNEFSPKDQLLPTIPQLKEIFEKLEVKLKISGFADILLGWSMLIFSPGSILGSLCLDKAPAQAIDSSSMTDQAPPPTEIITVHAILDPVMNAALNLPQGEPQIQPQGMDRMKTAPRIQGPPIPVWKKRIGVAASDLGYVPCNECPSSGDLSKMIRAMAEIQRVGQAAYAVFKIPADFVVWVVGLVRWCMGTPPSIRCSPQSHQHFSLHELPQHGSQITVEVGILGSKLVQISVFQGLENLDRLLWESRSMTVSSTPWTGMVPPKLYICHRVHELQSLHHISHVSSFMVILATELTSTALLPGEPRGRFTICPFPPANVLVPLFERLLPEKDQDNLNQNYDPEALIPLWRSRPRGVLAKAASLFVELLTLSVIENAYDENPGFYIDTRSRTMTEGFPGLIEGIVSFIRNSDNEALAHPQVVISFYRIHLMGLMMTGTNQGMGSDSPLISSKSGQVVYLTFLETMELTQHSPLRFRVFQGALIYEEERYAFAEAVNLTNLEDMLDFDQVVPSDFATSSNTSQTFTKSKSKWFCSKEDNYIGVYFAPELGTNYSVSPQLFVKAPEMLIHCEQHPVKDHELQEYFDYSEFSYCQTLAAALSKSSPHSVRVFECSKRGKEYMFFIQAVIAELCTGPFHEMADQIKSNTVFLVQGNSSLEHALALADHVRWYFCEHTEVPPRNVVILS